MSTAAERKKAAQQQGNKFVKDLYNQYKIGGEVDQAYKNMFDWLNNNQDMNLKELSDGIDAALINNIDKPIYRFFEGAGKELLAAFAKGEDGRMGWEKALTSSLSNIKINFGSKNEGKGVSPDLNDLGEDFFNELETRSLQLKTLINNASREEYADGDVVNWQAELEVLTTRMDSKPEGDNSVSTAKWLAGDRSIDDSLRITNTGDIRVDEDKDILEDAIVESENLTADKVLLNKRIDRAPALTSDSEKDIEQDVSPTMAELDSATLEEEKIATGEFDFLDSSTAKEEIATNVSEVDATAFDQFGAPQSTTEEVVTTYAPNAGPNSGTLDGLLPVEEEVAPISAVSDPAIKEEQVALNVERESRGLPLLNPDGVEGPATIAARELAANDYVAAAINGENDNLPNDELNAEATALIIENFGSTNFFKNKKSMEIDDPRNPGTTINVVDYIEEEGLTNEEEILGFISQTTWFQTNGVTARKFQQDWEIAGDAGRAEMLDSTSDSIKREALKIGLNLSADQLYELAYNAKSVGMDDYEIRAELVDNYEISFDSKKMQSGAIANLKSQIHQRAAKYMMPLDNAAVSAAAQEIYLGNSTLDGLEAGFRNQAIGSMPAIGKLIEAGYTPEMYFSSYKDQAESLLERNVDFLGTDRQMFINIMGGQSSDEFIQKPLTLGQTNKYVRSLDEWNYTDNARQDARGMAEQIAKTFGAVA